MIDIRVDARWFSDMSPIELARFFNSEVVADELNALADEVIAAAESNLSNVSQPKYSEIDTAVTRAADGETIRWSADPDAVAKRLLRKDAKVFGGEDEGGGTLRMVALVVADHPNSENYQYGNNGFPATRFFTGAFAEVAAANDLAWVFHGEG